MSDLSDRSSESGVKASPVTPVTSTAPTASTLTLTGAGGHTQMSTISSLLSQKRLASHQQQSQHQQHHASTDSHHRHHTGSTAKENTWTDHSLGSYDYPSADRASSPLVVDDDVSPSCADSASLPNGHPTIATQTSMNSPSTPRHSFTSPYQSGMTSPGFNGSTAREFFRSHLRAIAFTARLSHLASGSHASDSPLESSSAVAGEMSEEQFTKMAETLGKDESLATMRSMYKSIHQFRNLLVESKSIASSDLQKEESFNRIVTRVRSVVHAEAVVLLMLDRQSELFYSCATTQTQVGPMQYAHPLTHSFCGHVLRYKASLNIKAAADKDPRYDPDLAEKLGGIKFRTILAVPIFNKNSNVTAVILCINKMSPTPHNSCTPSVSRPKEDFFTDQDQTMLEFISILAGYNLENVLLFDEAVSRRHQTETLLQITELMAAEIDTNRVMQRMIEASYLLVNAESIKLWMIDPDKEELVCQVRPGWAQRTHSSASAPSHTSVTTSDGANSVPSHVQRFPMSQGILGFVASSGKPVNTMDARKDWRFDPAVDSSPDCPTVSLLVVPVTDHMSKPIAVIQAVNKRVSTAPILNPITGGSAAAYLSNHVASSAQGFGLSPSANHGRLMSHPSVASTTSNGSSYAGSEFSMSPVASSPSSSVTSSVSPLHYFSKDEEALLQSMAVSAGVILRKSKLFEEAIATRKKTEALLQISELMSADLQSERIMSKIVQAAYMLVNAEVILLYMVDEAASELVCEVGKDGSKGTRIPLGHGVAGHTALTGRSLNIVDAQNDWRFDPSEHAQFVKNSSAPTKTNKVQTILAIPVKDYLGKNVGVIEIINKRSLNNQTILPFSSEDEDVLNSLAYTAGAVLRKAKLFDEAINRRRQTEALLQINEIMSAEIGSDKIMQRIIEAAYTLVDAERITLFAVDPRTGELVCQVSKDTFFQGVRMAYGHGIVGHVALTRRSLNISNAYSDPRFNQLSDLKTGYKTHSILTVPVTDRRGQSVAVIQAVNKRGDKVFTSEDVSLLESMAVNAGMLLHKSRLFDAAVVADRKTRALLSLVMTATREDQSTEETMQQIGQVAYDALCADRVYIFFADQIKEELTCVVGPDADCDGWTIPLGRGIAGYVALTGDLVNVEDCFKHPKFDPSVDIRDGYKPKSILCMGVKNNDGEVIAVVYAVNKRSAARQAQLQWANMQAPLGSGGSMSSLSVNTSHTVAHPSVMSPIRPSPPATNHAHRDVLQTPPPASSNSTSSSVNPYSNALPPPIGLSSGPSIVRRHSRSSMIGGLSPWHSMRPSSSVGQDEQRSHSSSSESSTGTGTGTGVGRVSPLTNLSSPGHARAGSGAFHRGMFDETIEHETIEVFNAEDEEILKALCAEVRSLLIRHIRETVLEMNQLSMNEGVYSLMDMYSGTSSSRTALSSVAAHAVNQTHATTSGLPPMPHKKGLTPSSLLRPSTTSRHGKRTFNNPNGAVGNGESVPWPIGQSKFTDLLSLDFNVWTYTPDDLLVLSYEMFQELRLIDEFQIIPDVLKTFFLTVRANYHDNPFHNWYHGFSVLHFSYLSLRLLTKASEYLTQHDVLALMVASLCHDIDHPGNTNSFEINTGSELALIHNDLSVLESHHSYITFRILRQKNANIFCNLRKDTFQSLKKMVVGAILATDMLNHFSECRNLDKCDTSAPFNINAPSDRQVVVNLLIHSSDLSAQCFPTSVASVWEERITREFENQAAREKALGIPVAEFMQNLANPILRRQNQVNFIDVVLIPWWRATTRLFPGFKICYKNLLVNRNYYNAHTESAPSPESMSSTVNSPAIHRSHPQHVPSPISSEHEHKETYEEEEEQEQESTYEEEENTQEENE